MAKTIKWIKEELNKCKVQGTKEGEKARRSIPNDLKTNIVKTMMSKGYSGARMSTLIGVLPQTINAWVRGTRSDMAENKVSHLHGSRPRMDVATQCVAVKKHKEKGITLQALGEEFHVSPQTINNWCKKYNDTYQHYIDTLEPGVVSIKEEKKLIYGAENISKMVKYKENQIIELDMIFTVMHKHGLDDSAMVIVEAKKTMREDEIETLKHAMKIMES